MIKNIKLDDGIKDIIIELNKLGFITESSCSGLYKDHINISNPGYILFSRCLLNNKIEIIKLAADYAGLIVLPPRKIETIFYGENNYTDKYIGYESRYEITTRLSSNRYKKRQNVLKKILNDSIIIKQWDRFIKKIYTILRSKNMIEDVELNVSTERVDEIKDRHIIFSPYVSSLQICTKDKEVMECSSQFRGAFASMKSKPKIFEITTAPKTEEVRESLKTIIKEKIRNDLILCNCLIKSEEFKEIFGEVEGIREEEFIKI